MIYLYRYVREKERILIEKNHRIVSFNPEAPDVYFSPDFFYDSGVNAHLYLATPAKPSYRIGPLEFSELNEKYGEVRLRRSWAAFGSHGGGWEISLKATKDNPVYYKESTRIRKIGTSLISDYLFVEDKYFKNYKEATEAMDKVKNSIKSILGKRKIEYNFINNKDGAVDLIVNWTKTVEYTISALVNILTDEIVLWFSCWKDFKSEDNNENYIENAKDAIWRRWGYIGPISIDTKISNRNEMIQLDEIIKNSINEIEKVGEESEKHLHEQVKDGEKNRKRPYRNQWAVVPIPRSQNYNK